MRGDVVTNGRFMQALEGGEPEVRALFEKIKLDPRHYEVRLLNEELLEQLNFSEWTMGSSLYQPKH